MRPDDDLPEITDEMLKRADLYDGDKLIEAGEGGPNLRVAQAIRRTAGRPRLENPKQAIKLRLDAEVVEHFRATGPGWQTRINEALRLTLQGQTTLGKRLIKAAQEASAIAQQQTKRPGVAVKMSPTKKLKVKRSAKSRV
jgi:uncharacterized protein (DUF4415 family)